MNTPEWFGTIGVMNSPQAVHRRGAIGLLRRAIGELGAVAAGLRIRRVLRPSQPRPVEARPATARPGRLQPRSERGMLAQQPARSACR